MGVTSVSINKYEIYCIGEGGFKVVKLCERNAQFTFGYGKKVKQTSGILLSGV